MIDQAAGRIDYHESGAGPTVVLVPGSCSTGAAWRPIIAAWNDRFRTVTTSLLGYGGTAERRTAADPSIQHEVAILEAVIANATAKAGGRVHLVGHSFGAAVSLAVALHDRSRLASLTLIEVPAWELLRHHGEQEHCETFRRMTEGYFAAHERGDPAAIAAMIDFYGGAGSFASWPPRLRAYAQETTPTNILDWATAAGFAMEAPALAALDVPALVLCGGASPPAMQRASTLLAGDLNGTLHTIEGAAHFMIATHVPSVAGLIADHIGRATG